MVFIGDLLREVPPITKLLCGSSLLIQFLSYIQIISKFDLYFNLNFIVSKFQIWRVFTNLVYFGEFNIYTFFSMLMLYRCSKRLEEHTFRNKTADYLFFLILGGTIMTIYGSLAGFTSHSRCFLTMIMYLWSRYNQNVILLIFGLVPMKAPYVTWYFVISSFVNQARFFLVIDLMIGESVIFDVVGILVAHLFYFFHEIYPKLPLSKGVYFLKTPEMLEKIVNRLNLKPMEHVYLDD